MDPYTFQKRINEMILEIFPLDRLLLPGTVYKIFADEYAKTKEKSLFFKDRKYQRMREGYAGLFVAVFHMKISGKRHGLIFPKDPGNDFYLIEIGKEGNDWNATNFDLKEFTTFTSSFQEFVDKKIIPHLERYNIVVTSYKDMVGGDLKYLVDKLAQLKSDRHIWLITAPTPEIIRESIGRITIINEKGIVSDQIIDLDKWISKDEIVVFQDNIRFKKGIQ